MPTRYFIYKLFFIIKYFLLRTKNKLIKYKDKNKHINLAVLFLEYGNKYKGTFANVKKIIDGIKHCTATFIIIDNMNGNIDPANISDNIYKISGMNTEWEFSGWQKGIEALAPLKIDFDAVLFVNDSCFNYGNNLINKRKLRSLFDISINTNSIIGKIDICKKNNRLFKYNVSTWLRTNCFIVPKNILNKIDNFVAISEKELDSIIDLHYPQELDKDPLNISLLFKNSSPLNDNCKNYLIEWIFLKWHNKFIINEIKWNFYRKKVCAIINEFLFTAKCQEKGIRIIDHNLL